MAMEPLSAIGARIRALRKRRGLTQEALAGRIGRSVEALSAVERGRATPTLPVLGRLAEALQVPLRDFFPPTAAEDQHPEEAALFTELIDAARTLPLGELDMTVRIVDVVAARHGRPDAQRIGAQGVGLLVDPRTVPTSLPPDTSPEAARHLLNFLTRLYRDEPEAMIAALKRRRRDFEDRGDPDRVAFFDRVLKAAEENNKEEKE